MKKEILIAILIGFILGLIITFGIWTANKSLKDNQEKAPQTEDVSVLKPEEENKESLSLKIIEPVNNSISDEEEITIKGSASSSAIITIIYQEGEKILEADEEGNFETEISLVGGTNEIEISAYDEEDNKTTKTLSIIYSTAKI